MKRVDAPEILDSDACSARDVELSMLDLNGVNRRFGGVTTTQSLIERVALMTGQKCLSVLDVAAGSGEVPRLVAERLAQQNIRLDLTLLDRSRSHLAPGVRAVIADGLALPFRDASFDMVSSNLFAHHLSPPQAADFVKEALRVARRAVLINDLVRHPMHLALAYAARPLMRSRVAWLDGLTSVRRAYVPEEMRAAILPLFSSNGPPPIEISRHYLFRMGVIVWKNKRA
ncbi:MAG TPA: methyltransferase domain-containing protein [Candidatus Aquilonibacter sp.]|nr:methyltransferase domain-containing protein [Candidatus Aquilonibacter sp.]